MSSGPPEEPQLDLPAPPVVPQPPPVSMGALTACRPLRRLSIETNAVVLDMRGTL